MEIIKYEKRYYEDCKKICYLTAASIYQENEEDLYNIYLNYYLDNEPDNCFVVVEDGKAYGYILNCSNPKLFNKLTKEVYIPRIKNESLKKEAKLGRLENIVLSNKFDCHIHIDMLSDIRRKGYGTKLINKVIDNLKNKGKKAIRLGCSDNNSIAKAFYNSLGFKKYIHILSTTIMYYDLRG